MFEKVEVNVLDEFFEKHGFIKHKSYYFKHCYSYLGRRIGFPVKNKHKTYLKKNRVKNDGEDFLIDIEAIKEDIEKISDKSKLMKTNKNVFQFRTVFFKNHVYDILAKFPEITLINYDDVIKFYTDKDRAVPDKFEDTNKTCYVYFKMLEKIYALEINGTSHTYKSLLDIDTEDLEYHIKKVNSRADESDAYVLYSDYAYWITWQYGKIKTLESTIKTLLDSHRVSDSVKVQVSS